jgi:hypothetical protein
MKASILIFILFSFSVLSYSQPCKTVIPGMTQGEVLNVAGEPIKIDTTGEHHGSWAKIYDKNKPKPSSVRPGGRLVIGWNYGDQEVLFYDEVVNQVDINVLKYNEANRKFFNGEINIFEFDSLRAEIKKIPCE